MACRRKSRSRRIDAARPFITTVLAALAAWALFPSGAAAHGPVAPIATSYLARVSTIPAGVEAKVIDGDQRMWLRVPATDTLVVLDYRGARYLRFSRTGVEVNRNSSMYYLNQTPAQTVPSGLAPTAPPRWASVTGAHQYSWHDGRLHALASTALTPGMSYVGRWTIPLLVDGRASAITGGLWHANDPSIVWLWPIVVLLACTIALWRVRRPELDVRAERALGFVCLGATTVAAVARNLHGRPTVSVLQMLTFAAVIAFIGWAARRVLTREAGYFTYFLIAFVAIYEAGQLVPTLLNGYVLAALPPFIARAAAVVGLGCGAGLLLISFRRIDRAGNEPDDEEEFDDEFGEDDHAWGIGV